MREPSDTNPEPAMTAVDHAVLYAKGVLMGMGDAVPGISGGTIAVITHIYDKLIFSIRSVDLHAVQLVFKGQVGRAWSYINGNFLLVLALGILSGLVMSANTVLYLLDNYFEALMAFFIGLVLASSWILKSTGEVNSVTDICAVVLGAIFTIAIGLLPPSNGYFSLLAVFGSGAVAICAMILPGLSGAFILLLLGMYEYVLTALIEINMPVILVFMGGCAVGLLAFSRVLAWLLKSYHSLSYGFIIGMLLGSTSVLWPWQHAQSYYTNSSGELHILRALNVMPSSYTELTGQDPKVMLVGVSLIAGAVVVLAVQYVFSRKNNSALSGE